MKLKLLLLSCFVFAASLFAKASNTDPKETNGAKKNDVNGAVAHSETKKPLSNVNITAYLTSKKEKVAVTDDNGNYAFDDLKPGVYKFVFEKDGYKRVTKEKVVVKTDEGYQMNVEMIQERDFIFMPSTFNF